MAHSALGVSPATGKSVTSLNTRSKFVGYPSSVSIPNINDSATNIVDSTVSGAVATQVLQAFSIPVLNPGILSNDAQLPGYDIYNQDALSIMQLSLATQFLNNNIVEVYIDGNGMAYFVIIGQSNFTDTSSIRYYVPTTTKNTPVDAVFVRGLKPPIRRELREKIEGMPGAETIDWTECKREFTCADKTYSNFASIMYDDPVLNSTYHDGINGSYEKQDWENVVGFLVDLNLPDKNFYVDLKVSFSKEETRYPVTLDPTRIALQGVTMDSILFEDCEPPVESTEELFGAQYSVGPFTTESVYAAESGAQISDFIAVEEVYIVGRKIIEWRDYSSLYYAGWSSTAGVGAIEEQKGVYSLDYGKNWFWESDGDNGAKIYITFNDRYGLYPGYRAAGSSATDWRIGNFGGISLNDPDGAGNPIPGIGDPMGYLVYSICAIVSRRRPSVSVTTSDGIAASAADDVSIEYIPIVIVDEPPPLAYSYSGGNGLVNQTETIFDTDPTTVQTFDEVKTEYDEIMESTNGLILDITLPFADENECVQTANNIYNYSAASEVESRTYILGPDARPDLGQQLGGATINQITFSYSDSSSYLITATTGPQFLGMNSWSNSSAMLKTEEITKNGKVVKDMGDGSTYVVKLEGGMGETPALSTILERIEVGDTVSVAVHNNPVEAP